MLLERVMDLRKREFEAWTALGDKIGQSMAAMGIANVHIMTQQLMQQTQQLQQQQSNSIEQARTWYARADAILEGLDDEAAVHQRMLVRQNGLQLELCSMSRFVDKQVRVTGLVNAVHLNGRHGVIVGVHEPARYKVRLHAVDAEPEVTKIMHERHLVIVHAHQHA